MPDMVTATEVALLVASAVLRTEAAASLAIRARTVGCCSLVSFVADEAACLPAHPTVSATAPNETTAIVNFVGPRTALPSIGRNSRTPHGSAADQTAYAGGNHTIVLARLRR